MRDSGVAGASGPPVIPRSGALPTAGGYGAGVLSIDLPLWGFLGRALLYAFGIALVILAPWAGTGFYRWAVSRLHVPGRPNLAFTGQVGELWWVFVLLGLSGYAGAYDDYHEGRDPAGITTQDPELMKRFDPVAGGRRLANYLSVLTLETQTIARACGKSHVHNLEPEDLVALTVESAAMAGVPLAGTNWIPGAERASGE